MLSEDLEEGMKGIPVFQALTETFALQEPTFLFSCCKWLAGAQHGLFIASSHLWRNS